MVRHIDRQCAECRDTSNAWKGGFKRGFFFCPRCIRRNRFPNLFKKLYGDIKFKSKKKFKHRFFKKEERIVLYHKHTKDMSEIEFKQHMDEMKSIVKIVKSVGRQNKPKQSFKEAFTELIMRKT